ncbi:MAG: glycosyltransferase [Pseudomonadota bacterium]
MTVSDGESAQRRHLGIYIPTFGDGGVERMLVYTARGLSELGVRVDFLVDDPTAPYLGFLPPAVRVMSVPEGGRARLAHLIDYLRQENPVVLMSAKGPDDRLALAARRRAGVATRLFFRPGTLVAERLRARRSNPLRRWWVAREMRWMYGEVDGVIAVSQGVALDIAGIAAIPAAKIRVVKNPTLLPELPALAAEPLDDPWFQPGAPPVVLGVGGLRRHKDFATLLRAFAGVRHHRPARLVILGEGRQREELKILGGQLGIADDLRLPGFVANPYPYLARSAVFALTSLSEGSPNVLVEALALGTPVVATDCPTGPREITQNGRFGTLVPIGDATALTEALLQTLDHPPDPAGLRQAVEDYTLERSARGYHEALGFGPVPIPRPETPC